MRYLSTYYCDKGKKISNQDALLIRYAEFGGHRLLVAGVADGVGGLIHGEIASNTLISDISKWVDKTIQENDGISIQAIGMQLKSAITESGGKIADYGLEKGYSLGTTVAVLVLLDDSCYCINVGDSRVYYRNNNACEQITVDDRVNGHVLSQCIGIGKAYTFHETYVECLGDSNFLICTDGLYNKLSLESLFSLVVSASDKVDMEHCLSAAINEVQTKGETDNISAILIQTSEWNGQISD